IGLSALELLLVVVLPLGIACLEGGAFACREANADCFNRAGAAASQCASKACPKRFREKAWINQANCVDLYLNMFKPYCSQALSQCLTRCGIGGFFQPVFDCEPNPCRKLCC